MSEEQRLYAPDALRLLSLVGVFLYHLDAAVFPYGYLGVVGFLCLQGYLCMRKVLLRPSRERSLNESFRQFFARMGKLYPPLLFFLAVCSLVMIFTMPQFLDHYAGQLRSSILGYNNIWQIIIGDSYFQGAGYVKPLTHLWALSLEMQYYVFFFFVISRFYREKQRKAWTICLAVLSVLSFISLHLIYQSGMDPTPAYYRPDARFFSFGAGALTALLTENRGKWEPSSPSPIWRSFLTVPLFALMAAAFILPLSEAFMIRWGLLLYTLIIALLLFLGSRGDRFLNFAGRSFFCRQLKYSSYSLYLWHYPFFRISERMLAFYDVPRWLLLSLQVSGAIFISELAAQLLLLGQHRARKSSLAYSWRAWSSLFIAIVLLLSPWELLAGEKGQGLKSLEASILEQESRLEAVKNSSQKKETEESRKSRPADVPVPGQAETAGAASESSRPSSSQGLSSSGGKASRSSAPSKTGEPSLRPGTSDSPFFSSHKAATLHIPRLSEEEDESFTEALQEDLEQYNSYGGHYLLDIEDYRRYRHVPVTMIGDSVSVIASYYTDPYLPELDLHAKSCRQMGELSEIYQQVKEDRGIGEVLVVALGTNGDPVPEELERVRQDLKGKPMLLVTIVLPYQGQETARNKLIRDYAEKHDDVWLVEWNEAAKYTPEFFQEDAIHPSEAGCKAFCHLICAKLCEVLRLYEDNDALVFD